MTQNGFKFGMTKEEIKREQEKLSIAQKYEQLGYNQKDVISALIKEMRLGNLEGAMWWARVMEEAGDVWNLCRRLLIFAFEDAFGEGIQMYSVACWQAWTSIKDANIWFAWIERLCAARKFWEVPEGERRERAYDKADRELKAGKRRPIPEYAKDMHCKAGYQMKKEKGYLDNRFSGDGYGRWQMIRMYKRLGRLDPDDKESLESLKNWGQRKDWNPTITRTEAGHYRVESQTRPGLTYLVRGDLTACDCPHFVQRLAHTGGKCKHIRAVEKFLKREPGENGEIPF